MTENEEKDEQIEGISDEIEQDPIPEENAEVYKEPVDTNFSMEAEADVVEGIEHVEVAQEPEIDPEPEDEDEAEEPVDEGFEIVVDGKTMRVSSNKIMTEGLRAVQKLSAADVRLEEAQKIRQEARGLFQRIRDRQLSEKDIETLNERLPQPDPEKEENAQKIITRFNSEYKDLMNDTFLRGATMEMITEKLKNGAVNDYELYDSVGKEVRSWNTGKLNEQKAKQVFEQKLQRKRAGAGTTVTGVNAKTTTTVKKAAPKPTPSDIINEMRTARGQS